MDYFGDNLSLDLFAELEAAGMGATAYELPEMEATDQPEPTPVSIRFFPNPDTAAH